MSHHVPRKKNELRKNLNSFDQKQATFYTELLKAIFKHHTLEDYGFKPGTPEKLAGHDHVMIDNSLGWGGYAFDYASAKPYKARIEHQGAKVYRLRVQWPDIYVWQTAHEFTGSLDQVLLELIKIKPKFVK